MYKESKQAKQIIALQDKDGSWGCFHSLSRAGGRSITTEQALRRLEILGYTIEDSPIQNAVGYMEDCLQGKRQIPDRREKLHNWDIFVALMLSAWIRRFTNNSDKANKIAGVWAGIISNAFIDGYFNDEEYVSAYTEALGMRPKGGRLEDFNDFYHASIISDGLRKETEGFTLDYLLNHNGGIYYIYGKRLSDLPDVFASLDSSRYIGAIELLSRFRNSVHKLSFVKDWLEDNKNEDGKWDMGKSAKDNVYFPLSDSWRSKDNRENDCTYRIQKLTDSIKRYSK